MWNNPEVLSKLGKAMGGVFDFAGALEGGEEGAEEGEEGEGEGEETVHGAASAGEFWQRFRTRRRCTRSEISENLAYSMLMKIGYMSSCQWRAMWRFPRFRTRMLGAEVF